MGDQISREAAQKLLGISNGTLYKLVRQGKLKKYVSEVGAGLGGRRTYFLREDVERLKAQIVRVKK